MMPREIAKAFGLLLALTSAAFAQLNQNCTVAVLNRTIPVNPDGTWVLPNIPANFGQVKARATCIQNGQTIFGESAFFTVPPNGAANLPAITLGNTTPIPVSLGVGPTATILTTLGQTQQLAVTATYPDGSTSDVTQSSSGTNYTISNPAIATIAANGLVTAISSGSVVIQATNDGATGITTLQVNVGGAQVGGIPVSWLLANNLNPNDPTVALEDPDRDGLTNLQEYYIGTNPNNPDTDGDGLLDGDEVNKFHTSPLLADTDGDRIPDGVEVQTGTDPLNPNSYDLRKATATSLLTPSTFTLTTGPLSPIASVQLDWKVNLIDGKTTLDLTNDPRTSYASSSLSVCNLSTQPGLVFAGSAGNCTITVSQNTLSVTALGTISSFTPTQVSMTNVAGSVAVDIGGNLAYVATGATGMTVVDVTSRSAPVARGMLAGLGNAVDVRAAGQYVLIADSGGYLRVVQIANPDAPSLVASVAITGAPNGLAVHGNVAAVAAGSGGVSLVDISNPTSPNLISQFPVPGAALGVDFDLTRNIAAVAMGTSGLQLVDISNQSAPQILGLLPGGNVVAVRLDGTAALLADTQRSVTAVDITNPSSPAVASSEATNLGGIPVDIAFSGNVAITADDTFGRAVPVISVANPLQPTTVLYWTISPPGYGVSIAMDASFGYLIIPGTLRIFQYQNIVDTTGIPPSVQITFPTPGTTLIQGQAITFAVDATDPVAVASVTFLVNGQTVYSTGAPPYQITYVIPTTATSLTFGATASNYGNLTATAANVQVSVIPDPGTTVTGRVLDSNGNPVSGATVTTVGSLSSTTAADGSFSISQVPTIRGNIQVFASITQNGVVLGGTSASFPPLVGGTTSVGVIVIGPVPAISGLSRKSALAGSQVTLHVNGSSLGGATFAFQPIISPGIVVQVASISTDGTSASLTVSVPSGIAGTFALVATTTAGNSGIVVTPLNRFTVVNPNSTADTDGDGFQDVIEAVFGTDPLDPLSYPTIPTLTEVESTVFSTLNAPVYNSGVQETESVVFSALNEPVYNSGIQETESVVFSTLNGPVSTSGIQETESVVFSALNAAVAGTGISETESVAFSALNVPSTSSGIPEIESVLFGVVNNVPTSSEKPSATISETTSAAAETGAIMTGDPLIDSDGDGVPDWLEILIGTDPHNPDTDGDGLNDFEEIFVYHTDPRIADTDGDGFGDGVEVLFGSDPLNPNSTPLNTPRRNGPGVRNGVARKEDAHGQRQKPDRSRRSRVGFIIRHAAALLSLRSAVRSGVQ